jgi:hypothetical protein
MNSDVNPCETGGAEQEEHVDMSQALVSYSDPDRMITKAFESMSRMEKAAFCTEVTVKLKTHGYVYVAWNPSFPTLIKIGATARTNPFIRLKELSTAGVPGMFVLVCCMATMTPFQLEKQVHAHFKEKRSFGFRKEFFEVSVDEVVAYFDTLFTGCGSVHLQHDESCMQNCPTQGSSKHPAVDQLRTVKAENIQLKAEMSRLKSAKKQMNEKKKIEAENARLRLELSRLKTSENKEPKEMVTCNQQ